MDFENNDNGNNTIHRTCQMLVRLLVHSGVREAVVSPGSRNAPLIIALAREHSVRKHVIVDERSAAFVALGLSQATQRPVVAVCTSGTALLNYGPAVAEAYYQHLPLVVVSADRPEQWIDQNDSQTLRQDRLLDGIVKGSYTLNSYPELEAQSEEWWYANRTLNEAIALATGERPGPVHINIHIGEPICTLDNAPVPVRPVALTETARRLTAAGAAALGAAVSDAPRVMVVMGSMPPCPALEQAVQQWAGNDNVVVLAENLSHVGGENIISRIDTVLSAMAEDDRERLAPDILIYAGGAPVSRLMKQYLRRYAVHEQWRVGADDNMIDTMQGLTRRVEVGALEFFATVEPAREGLACRSDYARMWQALAEAAYRTHGEFVAAAPWCDLKAVHQVAAHLPLGCHLQVSNGMSVRYAQLVALDGSVRVDCNRGVSGIDGSTSTALGASLASERQVVLLTGDMSLGYDLGGLASQYNSRRLKIVVMCNGGGGIFRFIKGPSQLPELSDYFQVERQLPVQSYAAAFGFAYFCASDEQELVAALDRLWACETAALLAVNTDAAVSAEVLRRYYKRTKL